MTGSHAKSTYGHSDGGASPKLPEQPHKQQQGTTTRDVSALMSWPATSDMASASRPRPSDRSVGAGLSEGSYVPPKRKDRAGRSETSEPAKETESTSPKAPEASPAAPAGESPQESAQTTAPEERPYDPRELPVDEVVRLLRAQMADEDWRKQEWHHVLYRTIREDPAGEAYLDLAFGDTKASRRQKSMRRSWDRAQQALSASSVGRTYGAVIGLAPGGGRWHPWLHIPFLGGGSFQEATTGFSTPMAAFEFVERVYRLLVIEEGVRAVIARELWAREHPTDTEASSAGNSEPTAPDVPGANETDG